MLKVTSPNGSPIVGTFDIIPAVATILDDSFTRDAEGNLTFDYAGGSDVIWDDQKTQQKDGEDLFVDDDGEVWRRSQLVVTEVSDEEED